MSKATQAKLDRAHGRSCGLKLFPRPAYALYHAAQLSVRHKPFFRGLRAGLRQRLSRPRR
jgi:hypothetical protein